MSGSARRPTRWPRSNVTKRRPRSRPVRPMRLISFENDLDSLRLALRHDDKFPYLRHGGPAGILRDGGMAIETASRFELATGGGRFPGNGRAGAGPARPDFLRHVLEQDPRRTMDDRDLPPLVRGLCRTRDRACSPTPTRLRRARRCSPPGSYVAKGRPAGAKEETTIALTPAALATPSARRYELLAAEWIGRWNRSQAKFPSEIPADQRPAFAEQIRRHRQFR